MEKVRVDLDDAKDNFDQHINEQISELNGLLLKHYVIHTTDVRICPNSECGFAGMIPLDPDSERIECSEPLECQKCGTKWRDPLQRESHGMAFWRYLTDELPAWETIANNSLKIMTAEPCPNCGVMM